MHTDFKLNDPQTDAELVARVAALDPRVAVQVRARLRLLRLERVVMAASQAVPPPRVGIWQSVWAAARQLRQDLIQ